MSWRTAEITAHDKDYGMGMYSVRGGKGALLHGSNDIQEVLDKAREYLTSREWEPEGKNG